MPIPPNADAVRYDHLSFHQVPAEDLHVMDLQRFLWRVRTIPILVFSLNEEGAMAAVVQQQGKFTIVDERPHT